MALSGNQKTHASGNGAGSQVAYAGFSAKEKQATWTIVTEDTSSWSTVTEDTSVWTEITELT